MYDYVIILHFIPSPPKKMRERKNIRKGYIEKFTVVAIKFCYQIFCGFWPSTLDRVERSHGRYR
jgi:hypothetical protein